MPKESRECRGQKKRKRPPNTHTHTHTHTQNRALQLHDEPRQHLARSALITELASQSTKRNCHTKPRAQRGKKESIFPPKFLPILSFPFLSFLLLFLLLPPFPPDSSPSSRESQPGVRKGLAERGLGLVSTD